MTAASQIVDKLIGEGIDNDAILRDIADVLEQERLEKMLQALPSIEISFGWSIDAGGQEMIEDNLIRILGQNGISLRPEGHGDYDLVGTGWFRTLKTNWDDSLNKVGLELMRDLVDKDEGLNTGSGSIMSLKGSDTLFHNVDPVVAKVCEVSFHLFDTDRLKAFYAALDSGANMEEFLNVNESFLAPPEPPGIFRKVVDGVEIFSARCPGCKRLHGEFRTYDQAAGNRQCKHCTRDYVEKMQKVSTTGNFKHLLKKKHEPKSHPNDQ